MSETIEHDLRCLQCGYSLQGLDKQVCPECGRVFDLSDSTTYHLPPRDRKVNHRFAVVLLFIAFVLDSAGLLVAFSQGGWGWISPMPILGGMGAFVLSLGAAVSVFVSAVRARTMKRRSYLILLAALLLGGVAYWMFGQAVEAIASV